MMRSAVAGRQKMLVKMKVQVNVKKVCYVT